MPKPDDDYTITLSTRKGRSVTMSASEWDRRVKAFLKMTDEEKAALLARGQAAKPRPDKAVGRDE
jgi:hypothetical protein